MIRSYKDLDVWKLSFDLAMEIFWLTKKSTEEHQKLVEKIDIISKMLTKLHQNWNS